MDKRFRIFLGVLAFAIVMILAQQYVSRLLGQNSPVQTGVPSALKTEAITILNSCLPSGNENLDKEISTAADRIRASLDRRFWENDFSLNCELGSEVFDRERQSIQKISDEMKKKLFPQALAGNLIRAMINLMDADRILVQTLISEARRVPAPMTEEIRQAEEELSRAERERANNRLDNAVEHYKYAWIHACAARGPETSLPLNVILDMGGTMGVATVTPDQEATIEALSGAGTRYILTVPSGAIINPDGQTITMAPIFAIENFPLSGGFLAGVHLEPEGLLFFRPVVLTIVLPAAVPATGLMGFSHQQSSGGFGLTTVKSQGAVLTLELLHFTDEGIGLGSSTDCSGLLDATLTPEARDQTIINCIISSSGGLDNVGPAGEQIIIEAMRDWFNLGVMPKLSAALSDDSLIESAVNDFLSWDKANQLLGSIGDMLQQQTNEGIELAHQVMANSITRNENACVGSVVRTEKINLIKKLRMLQHMIDVLGFGDLQEVRDAICGGAFTEPDTISLAPESATLSINESTTLIAEAKNFAGESILGDKLVLAWENSNPTVVDLADLASVGYVYAKTAGSSEITVIANKPFMPGTDLRDSSQISVAEVASVEVLPATKRILIDGTVTLTVVVKDTLGNVLTGIPIDWTIPAGGIVSFDPVSQVATGKAAGSAILTATCGGKSGSSTINVVDIASITVNPATSSIGTSETVLLSAVVLDIHGNSIPDVPLVWTSDNEAIATVDPTTGLVRGLELGTVIISATHKSISGTATVNVDSSVWDVTWNAAIDERDECTTLMREYGQYGSFQEIVLDTVKGTFQGAARFRLYRNNTSAVIAVSAASGYQTWYHEEKTNYYCSAGGSSTFVSSAYQTTVSTEKTISDVMAYSAFAIYGDNAILNIGSTKPGFHTVDLMTGGDIWCTPMGGGPFHAENEGYLHYFLESLGNIPLEIGSDHTYSLNAKIYSGQRIGVSSGDPSNPFAPCSEIPVMVDWAVRIVRVK